MSDGQKLVMPRTLKGFQDLLPEDVIPRRRVIQTMEDVFRRYGFVPVETPALEYLEALLGTGGEETNKELFRLESPEEEAIALRFDQTVPFARLLAQYPERLKIPFRRYAAGSVWRADKPGPSRFREFTQVDIDVAGSNAVAADAEVVAVVCDIMTALGADNYAVLINNRKMVDVLLEGCGINDEKRSKHVLRVIDKLDKVGEENVRKELGAGRMDESGDPIAGVGLDEIVIEKVLALIGLQGGVRAEVVDQIEQALPPGKAAEAAVAEMRELDECLTALGVSEHRAPFTPRLARGLDYYTGPVFELVFPQALEFGSLGGGGRYNGLVARFLDKEVPCTGFAFGIDRLMAALRQAGLTDAERTTAQALVVTIGKVPPCETLRLASDLRQAGVRTETYFGAKMNMQSQLSHADFYGIPVAVILGEDELARGLVSIKDLAAGKKQRESIADHETYRKAGRVTQVTVGREEAAAAVKTMLRQQGKLA
jgi:histidyl-tRNA synthetase